MNGGLVNGEAVHQPPILITPRPFREGGQGGRVRIGYGSHWQWIRAYR
jgi:hypothetical protein